jgi:hypothetical protein
MLRPLGLWGWLNAAWLREQNQLPQISVHEFSHCPHDVSNPARSVIVRIRGLVWLVKLSENIITGSIFGEMKKSRKGEREVE